MTHLNNLLWLCSGVSRPLLKRCPTEASKYAGIGGTILFTGVFASLASGYALFTVFDSITYSIVFAVLWGAMVFNIDRYIVVSMKKSSDPGVNSVLQFPELCWHYSSPL